MAIGALPVGQTGPPLLRVVTPEGLTQAIRQEEVDRGEATKAATSEDITYEELARHIRTEWEMMRNHRNGNAGWSERLLAAQRVFNGEYDAQKLAEIKKFGGSEVYARLIALKCRGATSLLREVYLGFQKSWGLDPTPEPTLPDDLLASVSQLVNMEAMAMTQATGQMPSLNDIRDRTNGLVAEAKRAAKRQAKKEAEAAEHKLDDLLVEGGFYEALTEFLTDLPLFPFACLKGPVVRIVSDVVWRQGIAVTQQKPRMFWNRVSPFDLYWSPGAASIKDASTIEKLRLTRADLNDLIGLPGYHEEKIRTVLDEYGKGGLRDWADTTDSQRAQGENREDPNFNRTGMIDCLEYHGNVQGKALLEYGFDAAKVPDVDRDYFVQAWLVGRYVIKCQISPNPRKRHPYFITSFEKVPGTPVGNALPDILADIQDVANAAFRTLVNNMAIASGPQVVVDEERLSPMEPGDEMYPWKRWRVRSDAMGAPQSQQNPPIQFFNPQSHAQELLGVYSALTTMGDEISAIPRYITGSERTGGAARTASGLAMLMGNASKILQMVASNIDLDVMRPLLQMLYDMVMLTDRTGAFRGDESIRVRGVEVAVQRETNRMRQIEFLQATANPIDAQIMGMQGRSVLLRSISKEVGVADEIVPEEEVLMANLNQGAPQGQPGTMPPGAVQGGGQPSPPAPANSGLGVQDAKAMRGMA